MQSNQVPVQGNTGNSSSNSSVRQTQAVQPLAQTPAGAQPIAQPALTEHAARQQAAQDLMELDPPANPGAHGTPVAPQVHSQVGVTLHGLNQDIWQQILLLLTDQPRGRLMQTCKAFDGMWKAMQLLQTPDRQHEICHARLVPILTDYAALCSQMGAEAEVHTHAQRYDATLHGLASSLPFIELPIWSGFENSVVNALLAGSVWKTASLHIGEHADPALVGRLEQGLAQLGRHCAVDLHLDEPSDLAGALPRGAALELNGLHLKGVAYDDLEALKPLLSRENKLLRLSVSGADTPDPILPWLLQGSHDVVELHMDDGPEDGKQLVEVLKKKNQLSQFMLGNATFEPGKLILSEVLAATPTLEVLALRAVDFQPKGSGQCASVLLNSNLRELHVNYCNLISTARKDFPLIRVMSEDHSDLINGLGAAPELSKLVVDLGNPRQCQTSVRCFIFGFFDNGKAEKLELIGSKLKYPKMAEFIVKLNLKRAGFGKKKIEVEWRAGDVKDLPEQGNLHEFKIENGQRISRFALRSAQDNS